MTNTLKFIEPKWTEICNKRGQDPLGMQNSCINLYQELLPGISNVTLRVRYYGLYAWLSFNYSRKIFDTNPERWKLYIRRFEALFALVAKKNGKEDGVAGANWATAKLTESTEDIIQFHFDADPGSQTHYLKQAWGAYGAAYGSQLFEIGIFEHAQKHEIPILSEMGLQLSDALIKEQSSILEQFWKCIEQGSVNITELTKFAPLLPSRINKDSTERHMYHQILFPDDESSTEGALNRKKTLNLILILADQKKEALNANAIRWALYSSYISENEKLILPAHLTEHQKFWWVYHINDLSHICFETLLKYTLDLLESHKNGISLKTLIAEVVENIISQMDIEKENHQTWDEFLNTFSLAENASSQKEDSITELNLSNRIVNSGRVLENYKANDALDALRLLAILHLRIMNLEESSREYFVDPNYSSIRSIWTETHYMNEIRHLELSKFLSRLIEERIVRRHIEVAMRKLGTQGDYTFLIESENGLIRLRAKDKPIYTTPRLGSALSFLKDIHLVGDDSLTDIGKQLVVLS